MPPTPNTPTAPLPLPAATASPKKRAARKFTSEFFRLVEEVRKHAGRPTRSRLPPSSLGTGYGKPLLSEAEENAEIAVGAEASLHMKPGEALVKIKLASSIGTKVARSHHLFLSTPFASILFFFFVTPK